MALGGLYELRILAEVKVPCPHCGGEGATYIEIECENIQEYEEWSEGYERPPTQDYASNIQ